MTLAPNAWDLVGVLLSGQPKYIFLTLSLISYLILIIIIAVVELGTFAKSMMGDTERTKINVPLGAVIEC